MNKMNVTMGDIAREAGVSRTTASYVLNGRDLTIRISAETRQRVLDAARMLGYRRNELARAVVTGKNQVLGVLVRNPGPEPKSRILEGVLEEVGAQRYSLKLLHHPEEEKAVEVARRCVEQRLAGVVIVRPSQFALAELYEELSAYEIPIVLVDDSLTQKGVINVASDDVQGCRLAVEHLTMLGHRRIGLIEGRRDPNPLLRETAFRKAMNDCGLSVSDDDIVYGDWDQAKTALAVQARFRHGRDRPTGLLCSAGDFFAAVTVRALRRIGVRTPEDVSVVGYSDLSLAACIDPPLTTIRQPFHEMGRIAVRRLLALLEEARDVSGDDAVEHLLPTHLVVRESTGPAPLR